jgi:hypothetical protein
MNLRKMSTAGVLACAAAASFGTFTTHAATRTTPYASGVSIRIFTPGSLSKKGVFRLEIQELSPDSGGCFNLTRTTKTSGTKSLGSFKGKAFDETTGGAWGESWYDLTPTNCRGLDGTTVVSYAFYPEVDGDSAFEPSGTVTTLTGSQYYGGKEVEITGSDASAFWYPDSWETIGDDDVALDIETGPSGAVAEVEMCSFSACTVDVGTVSFYSKTTKYNRILIAYNGSAPEYDFLRIVETGSGPAGGTTLWLDAGADLTN